MGCGDYFMDAKQRSVAMEKNGNGKREVVHVGSPAEMIVEAVGNGLDVDKLERLLTAQERWEAGQARKAYHVAMAQFKANPPKIEKDRKVGFSTSRGNVGYSHATLGNVTEKVNTELSKYGLSASWRTSQQNGEIAVICKITHVSGHSEETALSAKPDESGSKNSIQAIGSAVTYLQRYTLLSMLGLATYDQDDDAAGPVEYVDDKQLHQLRDAIIAAEADPVKFIKYMHIDSLEVMPKSKFQTAMAALQTRIDANKKAKAK